MTKWVGTEKYVCVNEAFVCVNRKFAIEYVTVKLAMDINTANLAHYQICLF